MFSESQTADYLALDKHKNTGVVRQLIKTAFFISESLKKYI